MADEASENIIDVDSLKIEGLKEELRKLNLKISGSKAVLRERLRKALRREATGNKDRVEENDNDEDDNDEDDNEEDDNDEGESDGNDDDEPEDETEDDRQPNQRVRTRRAATTTSQRTASLSFKDVEDSVETFSGEGRQNVRKWLEEFEETAEVCNWPESQKIIYAKKLLRGSAKLFVKYEQCTKTWKKLKSSLISEFGELLNSAQVHQELYRARKKHDETYQDYVYRMLEIASHTNIEMDAKIQYIVDGIQDAAFNKSILYGARDIKELRAKLTQYEHMKNSSQYQKSAAVRTRSEKEADKRTGENQQSTKNQTTKRCYNCGSKNHLGAVCPVKEKGTKCFQCGQFGHLAATCDKRNNSVNNCNTVTQKNNRVYKTVVINGKEIISLFDTGSDLHLMTAEQYIKLGTPTLTGSEITCKGIGPNNVKTLGSFACNVTIDNNLFELVIHVVSDKYLSHDLILGSDLLGSANVKLDGPTVSISKRESEVNAVIIANDVPEIFHIETFMNTDQRDDIPQSRVNVDNIKNDKLKCQIKEVVENYVPQNNKQIGIKLDLILKDDVPVYERARRLAPVDKDVVNKHIREWLQAGVVRPSISEYASPVALVKKKNGDMRHVDALSRNPSMVMLIEEDRSSLVARIMRAQHEDNELKQIFEKINRNECSDFILENNVLYRKCDDDLLIVVPKCMQYDVIKQAHDKGHFAVGKMEGILKKEFWFAHMRERIEKTIKNCISCILAERKYGKREGLLHSIPKGTAPLDTYRIDYLGPLSSTKKRDTTNSLQEKRSELRDHAKNAIEKIQRENRENFNRKRKKANAYRTGDLVAIQRTQVTPGSKFSSKFFGPYEIVKVLRGDRYIVTKIGDHEGPRNTSTSADHMKRWLSSECVSDDESDDDTCAL